MFEKWACAALVGTLLASGCGGTTGSSGTIGVGGATGSGGGSSASGGAGTLAAGCYVAIRIDECCNGPIAASVEEIDSDTCLVVYPPGELDDTLRAQCPLPDYCAVVDCAQGVPTSRLVDEDASGQCTFVDECATDEDCTVATDFRHCCQCPSVFPVSLVESEICIGMSHPGSDAGCADCSTVNCAECATVDISPTCSDSIDGVRLCQ